MKSAYLGTWVLEKSEWESALVPLLPKDYTGFKWSIDETTWELTVTGTAGDSSITATPAPSSPAAPTAVLPAAGHHVTSDPPMSATGNATMFGLNWDGSKDAGDNGQGFFTDPATGKPYNTLVKTLPGVSLPREILMSSFGISDGWQSNPSNATTEHYWSIHAGAVQSYVKEHKVIINMDCNGVTSLGLPLVDAGPEGWDSRTGEPLRNLVDLTYFTAHTHVTEGKALATIEVLVDGKAIAIKGWDSSSRMVA